MNNQIVEIGKGTKQEGNFEPKIYKNLDISKFPSLDYRHAFFEDVGGKVDIFENVDFSYCVMTRAYFHGAKFKNCKFIGTRFIDCNFRSAIFEYCKLTIRILVALGSIPNRYSKISQTNLTSAVNFYK